jgi:hypothetical protein
VLSDRLSNSLLCRVSRSYESTIGRVGRPRTCIFFNGKSYNALIVLAPMLARYKPFLQRLCHRLPQASLCCCLPQAETWAAWTPLRYGSTPVGKVRWVRCSFFGWSIGPPFDQIYCSRTIMPEMTAGGRFRHAIEPETDAT